MIGDNVGLLAGHQEPGGLQWGVEPIYAMLTEHGPPIAPSTYFGHISRAHSDRDRRDAVLVEEIVRIHTSNYEV